MSTTISFGRDNLRKRGTMLAYIFANEDCGSFVYSSVTIVVLTCYKDVMEVVKCRKKVNMTFWRQHYERLIGVSLPPSLTDCRWPLPNCCVWYPLSPSHATCVNGTFFILIPFLYPSHSPVIENIQVRYDTKYIFYFTWRNIKKTSRFPTTSVQESSSRWAGSKDLLLRQCLSAGT